MYTFFQTWNLPGSSKFDYICFDAKSRKEAEAIASKWLDYKASDCELTSDIANGLQGSLVSLTASKTWKYQSGSAILNYANGVESYEWYKSAREGIE